ncbi:uncharacterized protein LOC107264904 [Cephus cinctus]|uniref:Uncharacterized protein LOC107264904 n=1 Tax=Cephus cinctus TaxID=211228 RepID=A0AAJ7BMR8_CEPCN|nr:uncharacterized protein LOC107264904 [Cephus cinctus]
MTSSKQRCFVLSCILLVLASIQSVTNGNLFTSIVDQVASTAESKYLTNKVSEGVSFSNGYWTEKLKESIFKTISAEPLFNEEIYKAILTAPFYGKPSYSMDSDGDILKLSSGDLRINENGSWFFCQENCTECPACREDSTRRAKWSVRRIREHNTDKKEGPFRYNLQFNIIPFKDAQLLNTKNRRYTGHVYTIKDPQPPMRDPIIQKDYILNIEDYDAQESAENYGYGLPHDRHESGRPTRTEDSFNTFDHSRIHHHHSVREKPHANTETNPTNFPDYYNLIYNEVLQAVRSDNELWKSILGKNSSKSYHRDLSRDINGSMDWKQNDSAWYSKNQVRLPEQTAIVETEKNSQTTVSHIIDPSSTNYEKLNNGNTVEERQSNMMYTPNTQATVTLTNIGVNQKQEQNDSGNQYLLPNIFPQDKTKQDTMNTTNISVHEMESFLDKENTKKFDNGIKMNGQSSLLEPLKETKFETVNELKLYKDLLRQLALSVITNSRNLEENPQTKLDKMNEYEDKNEESSIKIASVRH